MIISNSNENIDFTVRNQQVHAKEIAQTEQVQSQETTASNLNSAPVIGNMWFQVCGGVQSTLTALQGVVFKDEAKIMESATKSANLNFTLQNQESQTGYQASVASGQKQAENLRLSAYQSFTTGGITVIGVGAQTIGGKSSELDDLNTKLKQQQSLSERVNPNKNPVKLASKTATDDSTITSTNPSKTLDPEVKSRMQDLIDGGAAHPYKNFDNTKYPQDNPKYDPAQGSHSVDGLDDAAIENMTPKQRMECYKSIEEQIKVTHQQIGVAQAKVTQTRDTVQSTVQFATQGITGLFQTLQAPVAYEQQKDQALATVQGQANSTTSATTNVAQKVRENAAEDGKNTAAALMHAIALAGKS